MRRDNFEANIWNYKSFTNPTTYPVLTLHVGSWSHVEIWVKSLTGGATVNVYGWRPDGTRRLTDSFTTNPTTKEGHRGYLNGYAIVEVEIAETGTGTAEIEISANP